MKISGKFILKVAGTLTVISLVVALLLGLVNGVTKDKIAVVPEFFLKGWVRSVRMSLGCTAWSVVSLAALALMDEARRQTGLRFPADEA